MELPDRFQISDTLLCFETIVRETRLGSRNWDPISYYFIHCENRGGIGVGFYALFIICKNRGKMRSGLKSENTQRFGHSLSNMLFTSVTAVWEKLRQILNYLLNVLGFHRTCNNEFHFSQICDQNLIIFYTPNHCTWEAQVWKFYDTNVQITNSLIPTISDARGLSSSGGNNSLGKQNSLNRKYY